MPMRVLVVDDHRLARESVRTALKLCRAARPEVVGEAADGATGIEMAYRLGPDVVTVDVNLPDTDGVEVARRLKVAMPHLMVVIVTMDTCCREPGREAGASAYITKDKLVDDLPRCLDSLAAALGRSRYPAIPP